MLDLDTLSVLIDRHWTCSAAEYPPLRHLQDPDDIRRFHLRHALSHLHKQLGKLEDAHEESEHGDATLLMDHQRTTVLMGKMLISLLHYARLSGCTVQELEAWIQQWAKENEMKHP